MQTSRRNLLSGAACLTAFCNMNSAFGQVGNDSSNDSSDDSVNRQEYNNFVYASNLKQLSTTSNYQPFVNGVIHFFGYGQSLSQGWYGVPCLTTIPEFPNAAFMIGNSVRALQNSDTPPVTTTWVPTGNPNVNGIYPFNPMIATPQSPTFQITSGETPLEGSLNYFLKVAGAMYPNCIFVVTNCGIGGKTIAQLSKGADPDIYNRLLDAANTVKATATSMGLSYQVGAMVWTQGEQDQGAGTTTAEYTASMQQLQSDFLSDVVQGIAGQAPGIVIPWFCHQPDCDGYNGNLGPYQALFNMANTPGSDLYLGGPVYQYLNHNVHLTANSYRWHGNQVGKAMVDVLVNNNAHVPMQMTGASYANGQLLISFYAPKFPLITGADSYNLYSKINYPNLGFIVHDLSGSVPITAATPVGQTMIQLSLGRNPSKTGVSVQAGYNQLKETDYGTNVCDSDSTVANDVYVYQSGVQDAGENIATWNGAPLIGNPYPLNNYLPVHTISSS